MVNGGTTNIESFFEDFFSPLWCSMIEMSVCDVDDEIDIVVADLAGCRLEYKL